MLAPPVMGVLAQLLPVKVYICVSVKCLRHGTADDGAQASRTRLPPWLDPHLATQRK